MKVTDAQLNEAMAQALGWEKRYGTWRHESDRAHGLFCVPNYCTDRFLLTKIWAELGNCSVIPCYLAFLKPMVDTAPPDTWDAWSAWDVMTAEPRLHVIAALKALGKWPEEWGTE